jgi:hypothetical protein
MVIKFIQNRPRAKRPAVVAAGPCPLSADHSCPHQLALEIQRALEHRPNAVLAIRAYIAELIAGARGTR